MMNPNNISNELKRRLTALDRIYSIYDDFIKPFDLACRPLCATCCTCNMTLTTLEGYRLISRLDPDEQTTIFDSIRKVSQETRYQPRLTTNQIAGMCRDGKAIPEEPNEPVWGHCPLLKENACPIYEQRPFGCRCMVSRVNCGQTGYADIDDLVLTVNNLFLQYIEHIDAKGMTGNLTDILLIFNSKQNRERYLKEEKSPVGDPLVANHPIPVLMIPPEHRQHVQPILEKLQQL